MGRYVPEPPDQWEMRPRDQGQIVEYSYSVTSDGDDLWLWERRYDQSDRSLSMNYQRISRRSKFQHPDYDASAAINNGVLPKTVGPVYEYEVAGQDQS